MFILTEMSNSINSDYVKNISWAELNDGRGIPFLVKATGTQNEVYYLRRFRCFKSAEKYIEDLTEQINKEV